MCVCGVCALLCCTKVDVDADDPTRKRGGRVTFVHASSLKRLLAADSMEIFPTAQPPQGEERRGRTVHGGCGHWCIMYVCVCACVVARQLGGCSGVDKAARIVDTPHGEPPAGG